MKPAYYLMLLFVVTISALNALNNLSIIAEFQGEHHYSGFGQVLESLDYNHDGYMDIVVLSGYFGYQVGVGGSRGKVYIYYGGPNFSSNTTASVSLEGNLDTGNIRKILNIFNVGDINGDGFDDLCIYSYTPHPSHDDRKLSFFFGGTNSLDNPDHVVTFPYYTDILSVSKIGDVDGDGFHEVGLHYALSQLVVKKFFIIWGGNFVQELVQEYAYNNALSSISGIGDIDGDAYKDFAVGFTNPDPDIGYHMIRIYHGNPMRDLSNPDIMIQTQEPITKHSRPIGDVNGDGYDDFMAYYSNAGMHAWLGGLVIDYQTPSFNFTPGWSGNETSMCLKYGDLNGDGFDDVVGTNYHQRKFSVWMGSEQMNGTSDFISPESPYDDFGFGIATGDFNADGLCDLAIAADEPEPDSYEPNFPGYLWVYGGDTQLQDTTVANDDPLIPEVPDQLFISICPNPARDAYGVISIYARTIVPLVINEGSLSVFNIKGQLVYSTKVPVYQSKMEYDLPLSQFSTGIYLCRVSIGRISATKKMSILK